MPADVDPEFYDRADAHIDLSNEQMSKVTRGKVSASMLYGTTRFNAWITAMVFDNGENMRQAREKTIKYFVVEYEKMLAENLDDYIKNFEKYMKPIQ
jgi:arginase family enzyme